MANQVRIRPATVDDHHQLEALFAELDEFHRQRAPWLLRRPESDPRPPAFLERLVNDANTSVFVADDSGRCVGLATARLQDAPDFPVFIPQKFVVIDDIVVLAACQRRGIGRQLFHACENWGREVGARWTELNVYEFNDPARAFYSSLGFTVTMRKLRKPQNSSDE